MTTTINEYGHFLVFLIILFLFFLIRMKCLDNFTMVIQCRQTQVVTSGGKRKDGTGDSRYESLALRACEQTTRKGLSGVSSSCSKVDIYVNDMSNSINTIRDQG